jgi:hypothetical protein
LMAAPTRTARSCDKRHVPTTEAQRRGPRRAVDCQAWSAPARLRAR